MLPVRTRLTRLLDVRSPIISATMGGVSSGELAVRVCQGGGYGFIGTAVNEPASFSKELDEARSALGATEADKPLRLGIGYLGWLLDKGDKFTEILNIGLEKRIESIWLSFGSDLGKWVRYVRQYDSQRTTEHKTLIWIVVSSVEEASRAVNEWKPDVLVVQGCEAGGHGYSQALPLTSLFGLVKAKFPDGPLLVAAGGIVNGAQVAGLLLIGADGVAIGTRFAATPESLYTSNQKRSLVEATTSIRTLVFDTISGPTPWPEGTDGRALRNQAVIDVEAGVDFEERKRLYEEAFKNDDTSRKVVWAGSSVGLVNEITSASVLMEQIHQELVDRLQKASGFLGKDFGSVLLTHANEEVKSAFVVQHSWSAPPMDWQIQSSPSPERVLKLYIGLKQSHMEEVLEHLLEVSDPDSDRYGDHLSKEALNQLIAPSQHTLDAVNEWLKENDIDNSTCQRSEAGDWLYVNVTLSKAETMLQTKYYVFQNKETGESIIRTLSWSLPKSLQGHIDVITPTTSFARPYPMERPSQASTTPPPQATFDSTSHICNVSAIDPDCLRTLYGTIDYVPSATDRNKIGITGYLDQFASHSDLKTFMERFRPEGRHATFDVIQINGGGNNQSDPGIEANLDIQYVTGITYPTSSVFYSTGGFPPVIPDDSTPVNTSEPYLDWLRFILKQEDIPQVISTSYGDTEQTVPKDYATRVCNEFAKLGALGKSVLFATGDFGVGNGDCKTNDGRNITHFQPNFPASCPWVTAVGGTDNIGPETAATLSGGGFSNYFSRPPWQHDAVKKFLNHLGKKYEGLYNSSGRSYPDVAAHAKSFAIVFGGEFFFVDGTSAACPTFASVISLVNDYRLSHGKSVLGFLNPLLYKNTQLLTDITSGNNPGCGTEGFNATRGWDPVTGLGTPKFKEFLKLHS